MLPGDPLGPRPATAPDGHDAAERRQLTVMFCDVVGSTPLASRLDPEDFREVIHAYQATCVEAISAAGGHVAQYLGDGLLVYFGYPRAHEDDPARAVRTGLHILSAVGRLNVRLASERGVRLAVRVGIHTGLTVVGQVGAAGRHERLALGETPNVAARLEELAKPDTVVMSGATYRLVRGAIVCRDLGPHEVRGTNRSLQLYEALGLHQAGTPQRLDDGGVSPPLVGREGDVARLGVAVERLASGRGAIVFVTGDVGVGKSRLLAEVRRQAAGRELTWLEGRALSLSQSLAYWPFLEILRHAAGITGADGEEERWAKLEARVAALAPGEVGELLPYLATLLALAVPEPHAGRVRYLDGQAMGRQIFRAARHFFARLAGERPLVLVFEDLHWADQSSVLLLEHLLPLAERVPLLVCCVSRPDPEGPAARLRALAEAKHATSTAEIALDRLAPRDAVRLLDHLVDPESLPVRARETILAKVEGNPFFLEEVVRSLIDLKLLAWDATTGRWRATGEIERITIPDTVQGVILARLDRLAEDVKDVVKVAAVVGRSFLYRVLGSLAGADRAHQDGALDRQLAALQRAEVIRERRERPEREYIFQHALVHEATYETILLRRRRELHAQVGSCIERLFGERLEEFYGVLAYHYARAEVWDKAQHYLAQAGDRASRVAADTEALAHYGEAMAAYGRVFGERWDQLQRATLERRMGEALFRRGDHRQATEYMQRALGHLGRPLPDSRRGVGAAVLRELVRQAGHRLLPGRLWRGKAGEPDDPLDAERARVYEAALWIDYFFDPFRCLLDALLLLNTAERRRAAVGVAQGATAVAVVATTLSLPRLARWYHHLALRQAADAGHPVAVGYAYLGLGAHTLYRGDWDRALEHFGTAATAFREAGHLRAWAAATAIAFNVFFRRGDWDRVLRQAEEIVAVGDDAADPTISAWARHWHGLIAYHRGRVAEAMAELAWCVEVLRAVPDYQAMMTVGGTLARFCLEQGDRARGADLLAEAEGIIAAHRLRGYQITPVRLGVAELALLHVAGSAGTARQAALLRARRACRAALRLGRLFRGARAPALRMAGTLAWLSGSTAKARRLWAASAEAARALGSSYDLGLAHLEMGAQLHDLGHLDRAEALFTAFGASTLAQRARDLRAPAAGAPA